MNIQTRIFNFGKSSSLFCCVLLGLAMLVGTANVKGGTAADFDGDGKADISVFRPSDGFWYVAKSSGGFSSIRWGLASDTPVSGDYDGDGKDDLAVYRRTPLGSSANNNVWYILRSSDGIFQAATWLANTAWYYYDSPIPGDFDGDGKTDLAVFRGSDAIGEATRFLILQSSTNSETGYQFGINGWDRPVLADYDGDGKADLAVYRGNLFNTPINSWFIIQSSNGTVRTERYALPTDRFVPADYDGDKKADLAVWRPSNGFWYRINSRDNSFYAEQFGLSDDKPTPADYDGDGRTDIAVFRPSNGVWYLQRSTAGFAAQQFGLSGDIPIPNTFVR